MDGKKYHHATVRLLHRHVYLIHWKIHCTVGPFSSTRPTSVWYKRLMRHDHTSSYDAKCSQAIIILSSKNSEKPSCDDINLPAEPFVSMTFHKPSLLSTVNPSPFVHHWFRSTLHFIMKSSEQQHRRYPHLPPTVSLAEFKHSSRFTPPSFDKNLTLCSTDR